MTNNRQIHSTDTLFSGIQQKNEIRKILGFIEYLIIGILCLYTVFCWLIQMNLMTDSTNYITAAINLVKTGDLFVYANWPSFSMEPVIEPYTDYAPGLPLYLSIFIFIFKDPMLSVAISQSVAILIFYLTVYVFTRVLGFNPFLRVTTLLFFTFFSSFVLINTSFLTESLYISITLAIGICVVQYKKKDSLKYWIASCLLLFLSGSIKFVGIINLAWFIPLVFDWVNLSKADSPKTISTQKTSTIHKMAMLVGLFASSIVPLAFWFYRNRLLIGGTSSSHHFFEVFRTESLDVPFSFLYNTLLDIHLFPRWLVLIVIICIFVFSIVKCKKENRFIFFSLISIAVSQFLITWVPTLFTFVNSLDDRLLAPTIALGIFTLIYGINCLCTGMDRQKYKYLVMILPLLFLILSHHVSVSKLDKIQTAVPNYPKEMYLWQEIKKIPWENSSSHFYSDYDFKHQMFSGIPQRILWYETSQMENAEFMQKLNKGTNPFFLLSDGSKEKQIIENHMLNGTIPLEKIDYSDYGFSLYYFIN